MQNILQTCLLFGLYQVVMNSHTYHFGDQCSPVEPMENFNMERFLGRWYTTEKSSTSSRCLVYNISETEYKRVFTITEISENPIVGMFKNNIYRTVGKLKSEPADKPSQMTVKYPLSFEASFIVFATDYDSYAGVYSCQALEVGHRQSAMLLSRSPLMDRMVSEKLRNKLSSFKVNPYDLSTINHNGCNYNTNFSLEINENTFSGENIKKGATKVVTSVGQGISTLYEKAKKVYNNVKSGVQEQSARHKDREELNPQQEPFNPDAELI